MSFCQRTFFEFFLNKYNFTNLFLLTYMFLFKCFISDLKKSWWITNFRIILFQGGILSIQDYEVYIPHGESQENDDVACDASFAVLLCVWISTYIFIYIYVCQIFAIRMHISAIFIYHFRKTIKALHHRIQMLAHGIQTLLKGDWIHWKHWLISLSEFLAETGKLLFGTEKLP